MLSSSRTVTSDWDRRENFFLIQQAIHTRYGRKWGMMAQAIALPNSILGHVYLTSISQNDKGVINMSGIEDNLQDLLVNQSYCDQIYTPLK
jgi:hypothetical protein